MTATPVDLPEWLQRPGGVWISSVSAGFGFPLLAVLCYLWPSVFPFPLARPR